MEDVEQAIKEAEMAGRNCLVKRGNINPTISNGHLVFDSLEEAEQYYGCVISEYCEFDTAEKYRWSLMYGQVLLETEGQDDFQDQGRFTFS